MKRKYLKKHSFLPFFYALIMLCVTASDSYALFGPLRNVAKKVADKALELSAKALGIGDQTCPAPDVPDASSINCIFCSMFSMIYEAGAFVASASYSFFKDGLGQLILVFVAVSMALIILKNLASMGSKDPGAMLNDLCQRAFVCTVIYLIVVKDYYHIMNMTLAPIIADGLSFVKGTDNCAAAILGGSSGTMGASDQVMPQSIGIMIDCAIRNIEAKIRSLFDFGQWAWCLGFNEERLWHILPNPIYIIDGILLYIGGVFFFISYPWILADAILQLGISLALLPFAVAGFAFGGTKKYLPKTFSWILNSLFSFIFMFILIQIIIDYVAGLLGANPEVTGAFSNVADHKLVFANPNQGVAFWGPNMIKILFILYIGIVYMPEIKELAKNFAKGAPIEAGKSLGTAITSKLEQKAGEAGKHVGKMAWGATKDMGGALGRGINNIGRTSAKSFVDHFGHLDADGNKAFTIGRGFLPQSIVNRFGLTLTNQKNIPGTITDTDGNVIGNTGEKVRMVYDSNGNIIGRADAAGNVIDSNGVTVGQVNDNGEMLDANGNVIGVADKEKQAVFDQDGKISGFVDADGTVRDLKGNTTGKLDNDGLLKDDHGNIIASIYKSGELAYDSSGKIMGYVDANGNVLDQDGNIVGVKNEFGEIQAVQQTNVSTCDVLVDSEGTAYGYVDADGRARDLVGNIIGKKDAHGNIRNLNGSIIGQTGYLQNLAISADGKVIGQVDGSNNVLDRHGNIVGRMGDNGTFISDTVVGRSGGRHYLAYGNDGKPIGYISADAKNRKIYDFKGNVIEGATVNSKETSVLKKSRKSLFLGRQIETISNRYVTINRVYDRQGNLIRNETTFNHDFAKKHLIDSKGHMNIGALQAILNSSIGQNPEYRQAIMEQLAIEMLKKKGFEVGKYFTSRKVTFDPKNPNKIIVEQIDHAGKVTKFSLDINMATGQIATGYSQDYEQTQPFRKAGRSAGISMIGMLLNNNPFGHFEATGGGFDTLFGTHHEIAVDATTGEQYYIHSHKKYLFWGPTIEKARYKDRTVTHVQKNIDNSKKIAKIQRKLSKGKANGRGGMTRKTLFRTYESYIDENGQLAYESRARGFWGVLNPKNYVRGAWRTVTGVVPNLPRAAFYVATLPARPFLWLGHTVLHPQRSLKETAATFKYLRDGAVWTKNMFKAPKQTWENTTNANFIYSTLNGIAQHYDGAFQGFDSTVYTATSTTTVHSHTGAKTGGTYADSVTMENIDGSQTFMDLSTGHTHSKDSAVKKHRLFFFSNGELEIKTEGDILSDGRVVDEITKFKYSESAQKGHDSILHTADGNQVVERNGDVADNLKSTKGNGQANPHDLFYGLRDAAGIVDIDGQATDDFMRMNVCAAGRIRKTTKLHTCYLNKINTGGTQTPSGQTPSTPSTPPTPPTPSTPPTPPNPDPSNPDDDNPIDLSDDDSTSDDLYDDLTRENEDLLNEDSSDDDSADDEHDDSTSDDDSADDKHDDSTSDDDHKDDSTDSEDSSDPDNPDNPDNPDTPHPENSTTQDALRNIISSSGAIVGQVDENGNVRGLNLPNCTLIGDTLYDDQMNVIGTVQNN